MPMVLEAIQERNNKAVALLRAGIDGKKTTLNDIYLSTRINLGHLKRVISGEAGLYKSEILIVEGYLRRLKLLPPLEVKPGDVVAATERVINNMQAGIKGMRPAL